MISLLSAWENFIFFNLLRFLAVAGVKLAAKFSRWYWTKNLPVIALLASWVRWLTIVFMEGANLSANTRCLLYIVFTLVYSETAMQARSGDRSLSK